MAYLILFSMTLKAIIFDVDGTLANTEHDGHLKAIIFDVDGTLANTEHDGHLKAFNEAFDYYGLDWYWDPLYMEPSYQ